MEVILKQDVNKLGYKDDIVVVKDGYGANYLIPQGFATLATPSAKKIHAENLRQRAHKEEKIRKDASDLAAKLEGTTVKVATKVSTSGKVFGSVSNIQVAEALAQKGIEVDRRTIAFANVDIAKEVGTYEAIVKIYKDIKATINVEVVGEE